MKKAFKSLWIAALRSGNFKQATRTLRNRRNECCCLGVAADLLGATWRPGPSPGIDYWACDLERDSQEILNHDALSRIGLSDKQQRELVRMNDNGASFNAIANYIEACL